MRCLPLLAVIAACGGSSPAVKQPPAAEEGFVTADDGARLFYRKVGSGPRVLIVPGELFFGAALDRLAARHTVVLYDMRNRGRSAAVPIEQVSIAHDVADLERVRAHVGAETFTPLGWSYLGMMVMLYAVEHPERVDGVVQIGPMARRLEDRFPPELMAKDDGSWSGTAAAEQVVQLAKSGLAESDPAAHCRAHWDIIKGGFVGKQANAAKIPSPCALENEWPNRLDAHFEKLFTTIFELESPSWETLAALTVPVLTIHGTQDRQSPYGAGREWSERLAHARLLTVEGAAHMVWLDAPETIDAIDEFLAAARK